MLLGDDINNKINSKSNNEQCNAFLCHSLENGGNLQGWECSSVIKTIQIQFNICENHYKLKDSCELTQLMTLCLKEHPQIAYIVKHTFVWCCNHFILLQPKVFLSTALCINKKQKKKSRGKKVTCDKFGSDERKKGKSQMGARKCFFLLLKK